MKLEKVLMMTSNILNLQEKKGIDDIYLDEIAEQIDSFPIDNQSIKQEDLNLDNKVKSNFFEWRGQFSPGFIELLLNQHSKENDIVLDPFAGSGTVIFESANKNLSCFAVEINPSAIELCKTSIFINLTKDERLHKINLAKKIIDKYFSIQGESISLYTYKKYNKNELYNIFRNMVIESKEDKYVYNIIVNSIMRHSITKGKNKSIYNSYERHKDIILDLPCNKKQYVVLQNDARNIPIINKSINLVITSPPYINVFNYHQNYRQVMELIGWDILEVAKSEIGSNRKHRQNRYFTVIQYAIDMLFSLIEMKRVLTEKGKIIIVVGRESTVKSVKYENYKLIAMLAIVGAELILENRQIRIFENRFGQKIIEDILYFRKEKKFDHEYDSKYIELVGKKLGKYMLNKSLATAPDDSKELITQAIRDIETVKPSPILTLERHVTGMASTPHYDKLKAALDNPKCKDDIVLLKEATKLYHEWIKQMNELKSQGKEKVVELVSLLNWYKDNFEVELIMKKGSDFIKRQKGQLKLDNSILEEFFIRLVDPDIIHGLEDLDHLKIGPQQSFMSLSFAPKSVNELPDKPNVIIKTKDQDFTIGTEIHYKFSTDPAFNAVKTSEGAFILSVLAAECKINLDKTMYQEAAGTAERLKQGCPVAKYYLLIEYLDMIPEDNRLTAIDQVYLLRRTNRLPFGSRNNPVEVEAKHKENPIDAEVVWKFVQEIDKFVGSILYDPKSAIQRGTFSP